MFNVSDSACKVIESMLDEANVPDELAARLVVSQEGIGLSPDSPKDSDTEFKVGERVVLIVDEQVASMLEDRSLDTQATEQGTSLVLA